MVTIRRRGGLVVATAAVCAVLLAASVDSAETSLRGGQRSLVSTDGYYSEAIISSRRLEGGEGDGAEGGEAEGQEAEGQEGGEEKQEEQEQQYQEANNNNNGEEAEEANEAEEEAEEQQEEQHEEEHEEEAANDEADVNDEANDDQPSNFADKAQDTYANMQDKYQSLKDRLDQDVETMWSTSPSEWDEEFWKVFGILSGTFTLLLSCIFYLFCSCCNGDSGDDSRLIATKNEADKRAKRNHRGRLFNRMRTTDTDTIGSQHTGITDDDRTERPFVLIEDIENDDTTAGGDSSGIEGVTPVYARKTHQDPISPMTADMTTKTGDRFHGYSSGVPTSPDSTHPMAKSMDDDETQFTKGTLKTSMTSKSKKSKSSGIINETVDVWSEFLGFKKSKYNLKPSVISKDEDDDINLTDDEISRRKHRRSSSRGSRGSRGSRASNKSRNSKAQMKTGTYSNPKEEGSMKTGTYSNPKEEEIDVEKNPSAVSEEQQLENEIEQLEAPTPMMANLTSTAAKPGSPRRTALLKTKNLLKSIGKNKNRAINTSASDPKEESLLSKTDTA